MRNIFVGFNGEVKNLVGHGKRTYCSKTSLTMELGQAHNNSILKIQRDYSFSFKKVKHMFIDF